MRQDHASHAVGDHVNHAVGDQVEPELAAGEVDA